MKLEGHFTNWLTAEIDYKLMMLKYEALANPKTYQEVYNFFDVKEDPDNYVPYSKVAGNPNDDQEEWRLRRTSYLNLPIEQQIQITKLFKNLLKKQAETPPIYIR